VEFAATDLPATTRFQVQYRVDGFVLSTGSITAETGSSGWAGLYARPGTRDVRIKLDPLNVVAESDEADNERVFSFTSAEPTPPQKMLFPVGGVPQKDWAVTAYHDLNPLTGAAADYRGRQFTFDGNDALNIAASDFAGMDAGVDVLAALPGTVVEVRDGQFDRQYALYNPPPPGTPDNYVLIDHGNGWRTRYGKLRNGSVAVAPGQAVTAGQKLGLIGGSGNPSPPGFAQPDAFLRFELTRDGRRVETFLAPDAYWQSPPPFAADAPAVFYMTTINEEYVPLEFEDRLPRRNVFHRGELAYVYTSWHSLKREPLRQYRYIRPDGVVELDNTNNTETDLSWALREGRYNLGPTAPLGRWEVAVTYDGVELGRTSFVVADRAQGLPEIKVYQAATYVVDGRTTPIDFGTSVQGAAAQRRSFTIRNFGTQPLTLGQITLPAGFSVVGTPPTSIPSQNTRTLTVQLDNASVGARSGRMSFATNDADNAEFDFAVKGVVAPAPPPAVTRVYVSGTAWQPEFTGFLAGHSVGSDEFGFAIPTGAAQVDELPWANLDQVSITFSQNVRIDADDLVVRGVSGGTYLDGGTAANDVATFTYDAVTRTARWRLPPGQVFGNDGITLELQADAPGGVRNAFDTPLDGEWINPTTSSPTGDAFPSGDGTAGGNFVFRLNVLPGDADRSGTVLADDFSGVKRRFFSSTSDPGSGDAAYSIFHDMNGSGAILADDFSEVKRRLFTALPPVAGNSAAAPSRRAAALPPVTGDVLRRRVADGVIFR
jgi:murein DD-endopeptidase MepM/ murein hydrolase activator NlpD